MISNLKKIPKLFFYILMHWKFLYSRNITNYKELIFIIGLGFLTVFCEALGLSLVIPIFSFIENNGDIDQFIESSLLCRYVFNVYNFFGIHLSLLSLSIAAVFFTLFRQVCNYINTIEMERLKWNVDKRLQIKTFNLIMNSNAEYIQDFKSGNLSNITAWEIPQVAAILRIYNAFTVVLLTAFSYLALLFLTAPKITFSILLFVIFLLLVSSGFIRKTKKISESNLNYRNIYREFINERFMSWKLIRLFNNQLLEEDKIKKIQENIFKNELRLAKISAIISLLFISLATLSLLFTINIFVSVLSIQLTIILTFGIAFLRIMPLMSNLQANINNLIRFFPSCVHLEKTFINASKGMENIKSGISLPSVTKNIIYKNVRYSYPSRNAMVLKNLSFTINAGSFTAIIGHSGAGKSTLVEMLTGLITPSSGQILFDGINISDLSLYSIRSNVSYIPQDPILFRMTIAENMRYVREDASDSDLWSALKLANAENFVKDLPDQLNTNLGAMGSKLSGGQRQRIILARTFLKKPSVLILDEPTSALDKDSDEYIQNTIAILQKKMKITVILIAHRISSYKNLDQIISIKDGLINKVGKASDFL